MNKQIQRYLLPALLLLAVIHVGRYFDYYFVPDSDFFAYSIAGKEIFSGQALSSYQRLPLYSILLHGISLLLPLHRADLLAAQILNFTALLFFLFFLKELSQRFIGPFYIVLLFLCLLHFLTPHMAVQPRTELIASTFIVCGLTFADRNNTIAYLMAFLASLVRYEAVALIPILVVLEFRREKKIIPAVLHGSLASLGIITWLSLNYLHTGYLNPYHMHFGEDVSPAGLFFFARISEVLTLDVVPRLWIVKMIAVFICLAAGFYSLIKKEKSLGLAILFLYLFITVLSSRHHAPTYERTFMGIWIYLLCFSALFAQLWRFAEKRYRQWIKSEKQPDFSLFVFLSICVLFVFMYLGFTLFLHKGFPFIAIPFELFFALIFAAVFGRRTRLMWTVLLAIVLVPLVFMFVNKQILYTQRWMAKAKLNKADLRAIGEWIDRNDIRGKVAVTDRIVPLYYMEKPEQHQLIDLSRFRAENFDEFLAELKEKNVEYVAYDHSHGGLAEESMGHRYYNIDLISPLAYGASVENLIFVETVGYMGRNGHIYRVAER